MARGSWRVTLTLATVQDSMLELQVQHGPAPLAGTLPTCWAQEVCRQTLLTQCPGTCYACIGTPGCPKASAWQQAGMRAGATMGGLQTRLLRAVVGGPAWRHVIALARRRDRGARAGGVASGRLRASRPYAAQGVPLAAPA